MFCKLSWIFTISSSIKRRYIVSDLKDRGDSELVEGAFTIPSLITVILPSLNWTLYIFRVCPRIVARCPTCTPPITSTMVPTGIKDAFGGDDVLGCLSFSDISLPRCSQGRNVKFLIDSRISDNQCLVLSSRVPQAPTGVRVYQYVSLVRTALLEYWMVLIYWVTYGYTTCYTVVISRGSSSHNLLEVGDDSRVSISEGGVDSSHNAT